jgi:hypothetical protein
MNKSKNQKLFHFTLPLVIYEIAFGLYVLFYTLHGVVWFRTAYAAAVLACFFAFIEIHYYLSFLRITGGSHRKEHLAFFVANNLALVLYLLSIIVQAGVRLHSIATGSLLVIILMGLPPLILVAAAFIDGSGDEAE